MARVLLIHGGVHGAWCWERLLEPLRAAGHAPEPIDLPGRGADAARAATVTLDDYGALLEGTLDAGPTPVVVIAHSMGGVSGSVLAERRPDAVSRIIFIAALAPTDGEAGLPILQTRGAGSILLEEGAIVISEDQTTATVPADAAAQSFYSDCTADDIAWATPQLQPEPLVPMFTPVSLTAERYGRIPKTWILTTEDRCVPPGLQREEAAAVGADVIEFAGGHSPFLSRPDALAAVLIDAIG